MVCHVSCPGLLCSAVCRGQSVQGWQAKEKTVSKAVAKKGPVRALGAMSGTSLDGVDAAVVVTDGVDILGFAECDYRSNEYHEA